MRLPVLFILVETRRPGDRVVLISFENLKLVKSLAISHTHQPNSACEKHGTLFLVDFEFVFVLKTKVYPENSFRKQLTNYVLLKNIYITRTKDDKSCLCQFPFMSLEEKDL